MINLLILIFCIFIGFLSSINENSWDYFNYLTTYESLSEFSRIPRYEFIYSLFMLISSKFYSYDIFRFLETFLANYFFLKGSLRYIKIKAKKNSVSKNKTILILIVLILSSLSSFFGARQGLAIGLGVYIFPFNEEENKNFSKLIKTLLISLIHLPTGLIYSLIIFVKGNDKIDYSFFKKNAKRNILIIGFLISFIFIQNIASYLISNFNFFYDYIPGLYFITGQVYGAKEISNNLLTNNILKYLESVIPSLVLILCTNKNVISKNLPKFILIFHTLCFYFIINDIGITVLGRTSTVFKILTMPIIFSDLLINTKIKPYYIVSLMLFLMGIFKFYQFISRFYLI